MSAKTPSALYSVRMRASCVDEHISGAERIVGEYQLDSTLVELAQRGRSRTMHPDTLHLTVERLNVDEIVSVPCLSVNHIESSNPESGWALALEYLRNVGIAPSIAETARQSLLVGLSSRGFALRGAALCDRHTGERLEPDKDRGVRASRFDYSDGANELIAQALASRGMGHSRTREALALATKVLWAGVKAELCWSDEPDYTTGYIAHADLGYVRIPNFKPQGASGGRVWWVDSSTDIQALVERLERTPVLIAAPIDGLAFHRTA